ncbi:MAG: hypothetical protein Q9165_002186 [Trypethelium subeluteriae]
MPPKLKRQASEPSNISYPPFSVQPGTGSSTCPTSRLYRPHLDNVAKSSTTTSVAPIIASRAYSPQSSTSLNGASPTAHLSSTSTLRHRTLPPSPRKNSRSRSRPRPNLTLPLLSQPLPILATLADATAATNPDIAPRANPNNHHTIETTTTTNASPTKTTPTTLKPATTPNSISSPHEEESRRLRRIAISPTGIALERSASPFSFRSRSASTTLTSPVTASRAGGGFPSISGSLAVGADDAGVGVGVGGGGGGGGSGGKLGLSGEARETKALLGRLAAEVEARGGDAEFVGRVRRGVEMVVLEEGMAILVVEGDGAVTLRWRDG